MGQGYQRGYLVLTFVFLSVPKVAFSATDSSRATPPVSPSAITIPKELGEVTETLDVPDATPATKLLLLIRDAHVNYEGQKHLAEILNQYVSTYGLRLILVEGGEGNLDLSYLRARGTNAVRRQVAERYLQHGMIAGEEYLDIVSDHPLTLWGVDDRALYDKAMAVFLEMEQSRNALRGQLAQLRGVLEPLRARLSNEPLRTFEARRAEFDAERLSFNGYLDYLRKEGERLGLALAPSYPTLQRMVEVVELEAGLDQAQVAAEQRRVVDQLRQQLPAGDLEPLKTAGRALQQGTGKPAFFYHTLLALMERVHVEPDSVLHLTSYARYITLKADLSSKALLSELTALQAAIKQRLTASSEEAALISIAEGIEVFDRLLDLQWSPEDRQAYLAHGQDWHVGRWVTLLTEQAARHGVSWHWTGDADAVDRQLADAARFYETAMTRDAAMAERVLAKMDAEGERFAALIVGGFHTEHLSRLFVDHGVRVAVVTPWVGQAGDDRHYTTILKAKYQAAAHDKPQGEIR